jgi:CspA family cold shock protein
MSAHPNRYQSMRHDLLKVNATLIVSSSRRGLARSGDKQARCNMAAGVLKFFNGNKGYGFITSDDGSPHVFLHASALEQRASGRAPQGHALVVRVVMDQRKGKTSAQDVKLL